MWGQVGIDFDEASLQQMLIACGLPVATSAALMPDAHVGYGLPIGGVLATRDAVIPYAVGVDIACRMKLSVLDLPASALDSDHERARLARALERETVFGVGGAQSVPVQHDVLDRDWSVSPVTSRFKDKAREQLGTSGSGNHFVEFGVLEVTASPVATTPGASPTDEALPGVGSAVGGSGWRWNLPPGRYLALLSHSGSRGTGAQVCQHYSDVALRLTGASLPKEAKRLAWLPLESTEGREYWEAMNLMGEYAAANHAVIHRKVVRALGAEVIAGVENHHNFAWKERHPDSDGTLRDVIVHRKGATPAGAGVMGVIPGSMQLPGFVVVGKGQPESLHSASHGAGRQLSRTKAREQFRFGTVRKQLEREGITVLSAGADESPGAYKDIHRVMSMQTDLVDVIARFQPKIVKMAPEGEKAED
ncbi:MAG: RtcB family protein [Planctomycetota bacterium]|nr:RtcB family protein [Planctomycetota bacterium]